MSQKGNNLYEFEGFQIDLNEKTLWFEDELIPLAPKVLDTLCVLVRNQGRLMTKDDLMNEIWGETFVEERNLTQNIFTLRKIFKEKAKNEKVIETIPRRGYRFVAELTPVEIETQETLQISRTKQMRVSAEGYVSKGELTEMVKEITKNLISETENVESTKIETSEKRAFYSQPISNTLLSVIVVPLIAIGAAFWAWQNGYLNITNAFSASENRAPILNYQSLTDSGNAFYPAISPDKQFIAYVLNEKNEFSILLKHIETGSETTVVPPKKYEMRSPQFSADGNYLFYGARDGKMETTVYRVPIFGGTPREIVTNVNQNFSISPDGENLAYFRNDAETNGNLLIICRADGSGERILASKKEGKAFRVWGAVPSWSPDGKRLAVVVFQAVAGADGKIHRPYLVEINVADGSENIIKSPVWYHTLNAVWTNDGKGLIVEAQEKPDTFMQLFYLSYPRGEARPITNDLNNYTEFTVSPDDEFIIITEDKTPFNLQLVSVENPSNIRNLTDSTYIHRGDNGLEWTPDGKFLVYCQMEGNSTGNIWKMNVETLEATQLTFDKGVWSGNMDVAPDGETIYYVSNRNGNFHIWTMKMDGSNQTQITDGIGENFPQISSDGKWIVYATPAIKPDALWKKSLADGSDSVKLLENAGGTNYISPDMTRIVASFYDPQEKENDPWKYVLIPFDGNGAWQDTKFQAQAQGLTWNTDGSGIYFVTNGQSHTNIAYFSLSDKSINPFTKFDSQEISNIKLSPDGKYFAVSRGKRTSNLVRIKGF